MNNKFKPGDIIIPKNSLPKDYLSSILLLAQIDHNTFKYCYIFPKNKWYLHTAIYSFALDNWIKINDR